MFSQCPKCKTVFRVKPEQLSAANGKVRCSRCHTVFKATEHVVTPKAETLEPPVKQQPTPPKTEKTAEKNTNVAAVKTEQPKPTVASPPPSPPQESSVIPDKIDADEWFDLGDSTEPVSQENTIPEPVAPEASQENTEEQIDQNDLFSLFDEPLQAEPDEKSASREEITPSSDAELEQEIMSQPEDEAPSDTDDDSEEAAQLHNSGIYALPPQLEHRPVRNTLKTLFYGISILLLVTALALQYAYAHRTALQEYKTIGPWLKNLCVLTNCPVPPPRDLNKIDLADHMVQSHPRYQNSLLITATLINRADYAQPFPLVEVVMSDLQQKVVARRHFRPEQYLVGDNAKAVFTPNEEIPLMLEVEDPGKNAVGFEFNFY